jgi:hypothetical protein
MSTIAVSIRGDGKVVLSQGEHEVVLTAAQVMTLTETFCDLIERAIHDDAEPKMGRVPDVSVN